MMKKLVVSMLFAASAVILVSGCSSDSTPAPSTLTGTAATGAAIAGTVMVKDAKGVEKQVATGTNGSFTLDVAGMTPAYLLKVVPSNGTATLYSYATKNGQTVNLTPTTNLAMLLASNKGDLGAIYASWDGSAISEAAVKAAEGTVRANLAAEFTAANLDLSAVDLFTTPFTADGTGIDGVMDNLTIDVLPDGTYTFADSSGTTFDETATPPAPAGAISIVTVSGATHALNGTYSSVCYGSLDGRIDSTTITGTTWVNSAAIYPGDTSCSNTPAISALTATITKRADKSISGWTGQGGTIPTRADGSGPLSAAETVTPFDIVITNVTGFAFNGISVGFTAIGFYVFDDTASGYIMYRDDDGSFASASDPFVSVGSGSSPGTGGTPALQILPVTTASGNTLEMGFTRWTGSCYINGTIGDSRDIVEFGGITGNAPVNSVYTDLNIMFTQEMYGSSDGSCDPATKNALNNDVIYTGVTLLDGTTDSTIGWDDGSGAPVSAPAKQDGSGAFTDTEAYTNMTFTVSNSSIPALLPIGSVFPLIYVIDDTGAVPVIYPVVSGVADATRMQTCSSCI